MLKKRYTRPVTITLEEAVYDRIKEITDQEDMSISEWIRNSIDMKIIQEMKDIDQEETVSQ